MGSLSFANLQHLRQALHEELSPDLLLPKYQKSWDKQNPTQGFCSIASEAAWFILGGPPSGWISYACQDPKVGGTHWWLQHKDGSIFDPTEEQYRSIGFTPPYERGIVGKAVGFMGMRQDPGNEWGFDRKPGIRAGKLLAKMQQAVFVLQQPSRRRLGP